MNVYFDNAATTAIRKEVIDKMTSIMNEIYGNPSSTHSFGRKSKVYLENARKSIASILNAEPQEIIFTSGATESDNLPYNSFPDYQGTHSKADIPRTSRHTSPQTAQCALL